jgi:hypothetical protein
MFPDADLRPNVDLQKVSSSSAERHVGAFGAFWDLSSVGA